MARMITLMSSDGEVFEVEEAVAMKSQTIKHAIEVVGADRVFPLYIVSSRILDMVVLYCKKHVDAVTSKSSSEDTAGSGISDEDLKSWDAEFVKVDQAILCQLLSAANYLNILGLQNLTCWALAGLMKGKTPGELRKTFNIKNDFPPEVQEKMRREEEKREKEKREKETLLEHIFF